MKKIMKCLSLLVILLYIAPLSAYAQGQGNLTGRIFDKDGNTLPGASIVLRGSTLGTATDMNGYYTLRGISAGTKEFVVNYLGYTPIQVTIHIESGKTVNRDFTMEEDQVVLGEVVVSAVLDGQQRALNQQRTADNMMNVLSSDQMGRFPDLNVAEALQRLSGVTITRDRGEGAEIQLRGTPANFVNINVNGEQMMGVTGENGNRNTSLDVIPSDIIASMEVQKTLLPSNDGDAISGVINMRTATARSLKGRGSVDVGSGYNVLRGTLPFNVKAGYSKRFWSNEKNPEGVFGIAANLSFYKSYNGYDRLEAQTWLPKNVKDQDGNAIERMQGTYMPTDFRHRYQEGSRTRMGGTVALDYAPNLNTRFVLSGMYSKRHDLDTRYRHRYRYRGDFYLFDDGRLGTDRTTDILQTTHQDIGIDSYNINLDGETTLGNWKIDGGLFYSRNKRTAINGQYGFQTPDWRANNKNIAGTDDGTGRPIRIPNGTILAVIPDYQDRFLSSSYIYNPPFGGAADDPSRYNFYTVDNNDRDILGENFTFRLNSSLNYFIADQFASIFSFGAKGKFMHNRHSRPETATILSISPITDNTSPDYGDTQLKKFLHKGNQTSDFLSNGINFGPTANVDAIQQFIKNRPDRFELDEYRTELGKNTVDYLADENILAGYIMNRSQFNKLLVIAGARIENTNVDYKAKRIFRYNKDADPNVNGGQLPGTETPVYNAFIATDADSALNYTMILPNLQFKYDIAKNSLLRLAWTTGYSRPNIGELMPTVNVNPDLGKIEMGNPGLKAAYANNFDLLFEQYLQNIGILSAGLFYKHIDKFQYLSEGVLNDPANPYFNPNQDDQYIFIQPKNGEAAHVYGLELTLNSSLSFLPGFLKNLVFTSNYTYVHSKATTNALRGELRLPGQADHTGNIALSYSTPKVILQASANYNGKFIYALGAGEDEDLWVDARWQLDINGSYNITKSLRFYVEAVNVLNSPAYTYMGDVSRVYELEYTRPFVRGGLTYRF